MKKFIILVILAIILVGCELVDPNRWAMVTEENRKNGR